MEDKQMIQILLASHGPLAEGLKETAEYVLGKKDNIHTLCAYRDEASMDLDSLAERWTDRMKEEGGWVVLKDAFGGSVSHAFMNRLSKGGFYLMAGMNLPLLMELAVCEDRPDEGGMERILADARDSIKCFIQIEETIQDDEF